MFWTPFLFIPTTRLSVELETFASHIEEIHDNLQRIVAVRNEKYKAQTNIRRLFSEFNEGDMIMVHIRTWFSILFLFIYKNLAYIGLYAINSFRDVSFNKIIVTFFWANNYSRFLKTLPRFIIQFIVFLSIKHQILFRIHQDSILFYYLTLSS